VYLALRGKWRALWSAVATVVVVLGLAAVIGRPGDLVDWFSNIGSSVSQGARNTDNQALPAVFARLFTHSNDLIAQVPLGGWRVISYVVAAAGVGGLWWVRRHHEIEPLDLGVLVLVALLAGPITWDHYTAWSLLVVVLVVDPRRWEGRSWPEIALLAVPLAVALWLVRTWTTYPLPPQVEAHWYLHATSSIKSVAVMLLLGVALWLLLRPVRTSANPEPEVAELTESRIPLPAEG
jgi:Glycosyltransferase family 87